MNCRAFTLVELLVVVAIIALLAVLVTRGAGTAIDGANQTRCVANLRQWCTALHAYAGDHQGETPRRGQGEQPFTQLQRPEDWFNALPPYLGLPTFQHLVAAGLPPKPGDPSLFVCPAAKPSTGPNFLGYAMNMYLSPWNRPAPFRLVQLEHPESLVFLADGPGAYASTVPSARPYSVPARHGGCANVAFLDGHVAAFRGDDLGCGHGDPDRADIRWKTGLENANAPAIP